ncbi:MAG: tetratricopeptide repeat protein [Saprospiraceae bacterium]
MMGIDRKKSILDLLHHEPHSSFLLFALAKEHEADHNIPEAIHTYEKLLLLDPYYTGAYYHLGKQYELRLEIKNAIETYEKGISICLKQKALHDANELRGALELISMEDPDRV